MANNLDGSARRLKNGGSQNLLYPTPETLARYGHGRYRNSAQYDQIDRPIIGQKLAQQEIDQRAKDGTL